MQRKPTHDDDDDEGFFLFFSCVKSLLLVSLGKKGFGRKKKKYLEPSMSRLHSIVWRELFDHHLFNYWRSPMFRRWAGSPPITIVGYSVQIIGLMEDVPTPILWLLFRPQPYNGVYNSFFFGVPELFLWKSEIKNLITKWFWRVFNHRKWGERKIILIFSFQCVPINIECQSNNLHFIPCLYPKLAKPS